MRNFLYFFCFLVAGCGFSPLYQSDVNNLEELSKINIKVGGEERDDKDFLLHLKKQINSKAINNSKAYLLDTELKKEKFVLDIDETGFTQRVKLTITASYKLSNADSTILTEGKVRSSSSYSVNDARFSTYTLETRAHEYILSQLAREIRNRLLLTMRTL